MATPSDQEQTLTQSQMLELRQLSTGTQLVEYVIVSLVVCLNKTRVSLLWIRYKHL